MKLVFIYGPPASAKLTVARKLSMLTGFKVFDNHVSIRFVESLFEFGSDKFWRPVSKYRIDMLEETARRNVDAIFTFAYVRATDDLFVRTLDRKLRNLSAKICYVRLDCERKELPARVSEKQRGEVGKLSSRGILLSMLKSSDLDSEITFVKSLIVDITRKSPASAAKEIFRYIERNFALL